MKSNKRIWEIKHQTVCKIIGMALGSKDLQKIANKFGISPRDPLMDQEFALHSTAVHLCGNDNPVSRMIQKNLEKKSSKYAKRLEETDTRNLITSVLEGPEDLRIPLWAVLWHLAARGLNNGASVESALFGFIHMLEHRLLKDYWESASRRSAEDGINSEENDDTMKLKRRILDLKREVDESRKISENLRAELRDRDMKESQHELPACHLISASAVNETRSEAGEKIKRLQGLLVEAREDKKRLEEESNCLRHEVQVLSREVSLKVRDGICHDPESSDCSCALRRQLQGRHVAMVGGIDSLECHYREFVQMMGATFQRHDGDCRGGECLIEDCIKRADLVVCPIEINSHNAVKCVKKYCKNYGIPCRFPRTAGLSGFRTALEEHYSDSQVA